MRNAKREVPVERNPGRVAMQLVRVMTFFFQNISGCFVGDQILFKVSMKE